MNQSQEPSSSSPLNGVKGANAVPTTRNPAVEPKNGGEQSEPQTPNSGEQSEPQRGSTTPPRSAAPPPIPPPAHPPAPCDVSQPLPDALDEAAALHMVGLDPGIRLPYARHMMAAYGRQIGLGLAIMYDAGRDRFKNWVGAYDVALRRGEYDPRDCAMVDHLLEKTEKLPKQLPL